VSDPKALRESRAHIPCAGCDAGADAHFCERLTLADWVAGVAAHGVARMESIAYIERPTRTPRAKRATR